jgi:hypothetical protein
MSANTPTKSLEDILECAGHNGFGAGYRFGRENLTTEGMRTLDPSDNYCNSGCSKRAECWAKTSRKAQLMFPKGAALFDAMVKKFRDQGRAMVEFEKQFKSYDPYTLLMISNMQDGLAVAKTGRPHPKGRWTLKWPFSKAAA